PPALTPVAVSHAAQRLVGQVPSQIRGQGGGVGITLVRFLLQALAEDVGQACGDLRIASAQGNGRGLLCRRQRAGQGLVQEKAQGEDRGGAAERASQRAALADGGRGGAVLGRHVSGRAAEPVRRRRPRRQRRSGKVEIKQQRLAIARQQHVRRLQ